MKIFKSLSEVSKNDQNAVIAIGNFDGVHRGHQALIKKAKEIARDENLQIGVLTFEPHPRALFQPSQPPARLTPFDLKARRLKEEGVDLLVSLPFDWDFASQTAEDFIQHILIDGLNAAHIIVGYDFHFVTHLVIISSYGIFLYNLGKTFHLILVRFVTVFNLLNCFFAIVDRMRDKNSFAVAIPAVAK